jgi:hypothetical protein
MPEDTVETRSACQVAAYPVFPGKVLYVELDGDGPMPVLHFGMTGMLQIKGEKAIHYREAPKTQDISWPPRFMKVLARFQFTIRFRDDIVVRPTSLRRHVRLCPRTGLPRRSTSWQNSTLRFPDARASDI